jgi:hypothetical protein
LLAEAVQLAKLSLDLDIDVQRLLAAADAALVACDHQLAHLLRQLRVRPMAGRRGPGQQLGQLRIDVDWPLASSQLPVGLGLEQLAKLGLARLRRARGGVVRDPPREVAVELDRELPLPDLPQGVARPENEGEQGDGDRRKDHDQDHITRAEADRDGRHPFS